MGSLRTAADRDAAKAEIDGRKQRGEITPRQAKREKEQVDVRYEAYQTSAAKSRAIGGRGAA